MELRLVHHFGKRHFGHTHTYIHIYPHTYIFICFLSLHAHVRQRSFNTLCEYVCHGCFAVLVGKDIEVQYSTAYMWCLQDALEPNLGKSQREEPFQGSRPVVSNPRVNFRGGRNHSNIAAITRVNFRGGRVHSKVADLLL